MSVPLSCLQLPLLDLYVINLPQFKVCKIKERVWKICIRFPFLFLIVEIKWSCLIIYVNVNGEKKHFCIKTRAAYSQCNGLQLHGKYYGSLQK